MHGYCGYINRDDEKQLEFEWKFTTIGGGVEMQYFASPRSRIEPEPVLPVAGRLAFRGYRLPCAAVGGGWPFRCSGVGSHVWTGVG